MKTAKDLTIQLPRDSGRVLIPMNYLIAGGAGFIGSHFAHRVLADGRSTVTVFDNFASGREWHLDGPGRDRITIVRGDLKDLPAITNAMAGHDVVVHFASNPDIARAAIEPTIDFWEGTYLTQNLIEAMRVSGVRRLIYASGSGVYGDTGDAPVFEDYAPLVPVSTYGARACEALIASYVHLYDFRAVAFRFANVVGPHQTHGVGYDFVRRLLRDPARLSILCDGNQSKSYIYVDDVVSALVLHADRNAPGFGYYNVATEDYVTVREIAGLVVDALGLKDVRYEFAGGARGWRGDVPVVRFNTEKLRALGWKNQRTSVEALRDSVLSMIDDARSGRFDG